MSEMTWDAKYSVGIEEMDDQHREFLAIHEELRAASLRGRGHRIMEDVLAKVQAHAERHFADEERLMREMAYPDLEFHILEHQQLLRKVRRFKMKHDMDLERITVPVLKFLEFWIKRHILDSDMQYGRHFAERQGEAGDGDTAADEDAGAAAETADQGTRRTA
jgi:hemerythrin